jgi:hypothetical protein
MNPRILPPTWLLLGMLPVLLRSLSPGGGLSHCPIWVFEDHPERAPCDGLLGMLPRAAPTIEELN